ncbi:MAG: PLP-dependent aminotransferase family protein [Ilumatobacter sp.]
MRDLLLDLDFDVASRSGRRLAVEHALREAIRSGRLVNGTVLPSSRVLAIDLDVSRSTVVAAYEQLNAEGFLDARPGSVTTVAFVRPDPDQPLERDVMGSTPAHDFRPGEPDTSAFPRTLWQRACRIVLTSAPDAAFGYPDPRGTPALRAALADHLARTRSVSAAPGSVRVFGGFASALGFLGEALRWMGVDRIATEDPMFAFHDDILRLAGLATEPVPVDAHGIDVEQLRATGCRAVLVTPAHQYPLGVTMSPQRRADLVAWAREVDGWIIEDDYDGEFRYDRHPIGALQALAPERVAYAGTASKSLGAALRLGWVVVPTGLDRDLFRVTHTRAGVSGIEQLVLAELIGRGDLDRHVRKMRNHYRRRRKQVATMLADAAPWLDLTQASAGLHLCASINTTGPDEQHVLDAAQAAGIGLMGLRTHHRGRSTQQGFAIGFSRPGEHHFPAAIEQLERLLAAY